MLASWDIPIKIVGLLVTLFIAAIGWNLPRLAERRRRRKFLELLRRELQEMGPAKVVDLPGNVRWTDLLTAKGKRFIHREIFSNPASGRDFVLSLDADLAYEATQMWSCFDRAAEEETSSSVQAKLAESFLNYFVAVSQKVDSSLTSRFQLFRKSKSSNWPSQSGRKLGETAAPLDPMQLIYGRWKEQLAQLFPNLKSTAAEVAKPEITDGEGKHTL